MDNFTNWLKEVMHLIVPGIVYTIDLLLFVLIWTNQSIPIDYNLITGNIVLFFFILLFFAYVTGQITQHAFQRVLWWIKPEFSKENKRLVKKIKDKSEPQKNNRRTMLMYRYLFISILILLILIIASSIVKSNSADYKLIVTIILGYLVLTVFAYLYVRTIDKHFKIDD